MNKKGICSLISISAGRLKSPPIDGFSWSKSIAGDFNRPADMEINEQYLFCAYAELLCDLFV